MMKALLVAPMAALLMIGFATQLEAIAKDTSDKALAFTDDMNKAMDCATRGIPITVCSPNLTSYDFSPETAEFQKTLEDMQAQLEAQEKKIQELEQEQN